MALTDLDCLADWLLCLVLLVVVVVAVMMTGMPPRLDELKSEHWSGQSVRDMTDNLPTAVQSLLGEEGLARWVKNTGTACMHVLFR
jgi:hypothetical protein